MFSAKVVLEDVSFLACLKGHIVKHIWLSISCEKKYKEDVRLQFHLVLILQMNKTFLILGQNSTVSVDGKDTFISFTTHLCKWHVFHTIVYHAFFKKNIYCL